MSLFLLRGCNLPYCIKGLLDFENGFNILVVSGSHLCSCDPGLPLQFELCFLKK